MITHPISSFHDLAIWAENILGVDGNQAQHVARAIWDRDDFPSPGNGTELTEYVAALDAVWLMAECQRCQL
jgi:hypothetical protein